MRRGNLEDLSGSVYRGRAGEYGWRIAGKGALLKFWG